MFGTRIVRLFAYGLLSVVLVLYLSAIGLSDQSIGVLLTLTLVGDAAISLLITRVADRVGRRRMLLVGAGLMSLAGGVFALTSNLLLLILVAFVGTLSPSGNEVGPFLAIEQASLAHITLSQRRTHVFAWYNLVGSFATALGALSSGLLTDGLQRIGSSPLGSYRALFALYAGLGVILALLFTTLSAQVEVERSAFSPATSFSGLHRSRAVVRGLSVLFMVDSFAGGLVVQSLLAYWLHLRFGAETVVLGQLFFGVHFLAGLSALVAARLATRFGLINTMVFTHLPANIFLLLIPLMPTFPLAMTMVLLRYCVAQMDVPTRHSYLMAMVAPDERSAAAGVTTVARTAASAMAPTLTGALLGASFLSTPFFIAGGLKIIYDLALYFRFRDIKPPEEK
ncbi:MAG: MFS transporter [Deltaproteobacteria bacterium]|nr:MFS transporter [Deltaproteobacteria bacterium]